MEFLKSSFCTSRFFIFLTGLFISFIFCGSQKESKNLVPNPSFEQDITDKTGDWVKNRWRGEAVLEQEAAGRTGNRSVMISSEKGADAAFSVVVPVRPFSKYRLSGWIKTENLTSANGKGALFNLHRVRDAETKPVTGTNDWTEMKLIFDTGYKDAVQINCLFGGWGQAAGKAWFDDICLELISTTELKPEVTINTGKKSDPISKYIYGQFIEHLGRCIYGGIWAEMLEDRKFYYTAGDSLSPWEIIGDKSNVKMKTGNPYVGEHTPEISMPGNGRKAGIVQGSLSLINGKKYTGRIIVAGETGGSPVEVSLVWGERENDRQIVPVKTIGKEYKKIPLKFISGATTQTGRLEISGAESGVFSVGTVSLMPEDNVKGFRPDVLKLLRELNSPVYRWPGGNFVSGYDWKDGIGDPDKRPPRKNPAWKGVEHNDVGVHEFIDFCRLIKTEPYITVNTGLGTVELAAEEVEYCNGPVNTPMGKLRAKNGHPEPFDVKWWAVGNEMYGNWQLGHMPIDDYVKKHNRIVSAMRKVDPGIKPVAVGAVGKWDEKILAGCADYMDLISEHFYCGERPGLMGHTIQCAESVKRIANSVREYHKIIPELAGKKIQIALDEWNYWYGPYIYGELGVRYFLKDGLGIASGLHEYFRNTDIIFMANYAQTVNVIGCIKTNKTKSVFATTGLVLKMYRAHFGTVPVEITGAPEPLDVMAALKENNNVITIGIVNPTLEEQELVLSLPNISFKSQAKLWEISGNDPMAYNEPGKEPNVEIIEKTVKSPGNKIRVKPLSVSIYEINIK